MRCGHQDRWHRTPGMRGVACYDQIYPHSFLLEQSDVAHWRLKTLPELEGMDQLQRWHLCRLAVNRAGADGVHQWVIVSEWGASIPIGMFYSLFAYLYWDPSVALAEWYTGVEFDLTAQGAETCTNIAAVVWVIGTALSSWLGFVLLVGPLRMRLLRGYIREILTAG